MDIRDFYTAACHQHIGGVQRAEQQDRVAILWRDSACLAVLADGLGGHDHAAFAAQTAVDVAKEVFQADPVRGVAHLFDTIVATAHQRISARVPRKNDRSIRAYPGTTCVLLHLAADRASWTHLGDSRLYWCQGGHSVHRTTDHCFPEGGMSACLGGGFCNPPPLDIGAATISAGDSLVLCSDGLWENLPEEDEHYIGDVLQRYGVDEGVRRLVADARKRGGDYCDNVSIAAVCRRNDD